MAALNPRDTLAQVAGMYGYDPAAVVSINLSQEEALIKFRLAGPVAGEFTIITRGFLMSDWTRALLDGMAQQYGYDAGAVIGVSIDSHESQIRYRVTREDGLSQFVQADTFGIPEPTPVPTLAATDTGAAPPAPAPAP